MLKIGKMKKIKQKENKLNRIKKNEDIIHKDKKRINSKRMKIKTSTFIAKIN